MTALRVLNALLWAGVILYMASGAWAAATGRGVRWGDPMRLACFVTAVVFELGFTRLIFAPEHQGWAATIYVLAAFDAVFIFRLGRSYGRGKRLTDLPERADG